MSTREVAREANRDLGRFVGLLVDGLSLPERWALAGYWIALELYSPERLPLRKIQAIASQPAECIEQLRSRGLDPARFELQLLSQPYRP